MKAIVLDGFGGPERMRIGDVAAPSPKPDQVLITVAATSVNRPDVIQREGRYPPPPGESETLGLDVAGTIAALGDAVESWQVGDRVMALVGGGAYAEQVAAYANHLMPIPSGLRFEEAACIPETFITAYQNVFLNAQLRDGEAILIHGGGGGVGSAAIQICKALTPATRVLTTLSGTKVARAAALGADVAIDYETEDFVARVREVTDGRGVDVVLDHIGGAYFERNLQSLGVGGRLVVIATVGGREAALDLARLMVKRQSIIGSVLRARSIEEKGRIIARFVEDVMPHLATRRISPVIDTVLPLAEAAEAHRRLEAREHFGKIVLTVAPHVGAAA
jgi:putative PIG3 family NAD(P)H quinone oxidoreductase